MNRFISAISFLAVLCSSGGCTYWYQQDKSFKECEQDLRRCYRELKKYADMDSIGTYEDNFMKDCMKQKGYQLLTEDKLPRYVRRRDPEMDTFWLLAGVSGTLEER